jgi:hypothetical protein
MKTIPKTRASNVTPFVLEGRWPLDGLDQPTMRWLSKIAKRKHVAVVDVIYEALDSFVAKWEAEAELEKNYQVPTPLNGGSATDGRFQSDESSQLFLRVRNETPSVAAMCIQDPDCSAVGINHRHTAPLQPTLLRLSAAFTDCC